MWLFPVVAAAVNILVVVIGVTAAAAVIEDFPTVDESVRRDVIEISGQSIVEKSLELAS